MSKIKSSGYARFADDELEFGGTVYYSKLSKNKTKEHQGKPDGKSKDKKKDYSSERRAKRGE